LALVNKRWDHFVLGDILSKQEVQWGDRTPFHVGLDIELISKIFDRTDCSFVRVMVAVGGDGIPDVIGPVSGGGRFQIVGLGPRLDRSVDSLTLLV